MADRVQLLGEGSYGCAFKPSLKCSSPVKIGDSNKPNEVAKVFVDKDDFKKEYKQVKVAAKVDPERKSLLVPIGYCRISREELVRHPASMECDAVQQDYGATPQKRYYQMNMPFGGSRLDTFVKGSKLDAVAFAKILVPIMEGLEMLEKKGYCHQDIKGGNLLVTPAGKGMIIDFTLMIKASDMYTDANQRRRRYSYYPYPPEYKVFNYIQEQQCVRPPCLPIHEIQENIDSFGSTRSKAVYDFIGGPTKLRAEVVKFYEWAATVPASKLRKTFDAFSNRVDVYSLGMVIASLLPYITNAVRLTEAVKGMIAVDPRARFTPAQALAVIKAIV